MNKLLAGALVSIGLTAVTAPLTMAQTANPSATPGAQAHQGMRQHAQRPFKLPSERVEARLDYLWKELGITSAQEPQWNAFANTLRRQAIERDKRVQEWRAQAGQGAEREKLTAIQRLERRQQRMVAAAANMNELLAVQKPLYAALSDEQKLVADKVMASRGHHGRHHRMHRGA
jgi:hypothetical protein